MVELSHHWIQDDSLPDIKHVFTEGKEKTIKGKWGHCDCCDTGIWELDGPVCINCAEYNKEILARLARAEKACRTLMQFEWSADGDEDGGSLDVYWRAVREAREAVGDYDPE